MRTHRRMEDGGRQVAWALLCLALLSACSGGSPSSKATLGEPAPSAGAEGLRILYPPANGVVCGEITVEAAADEALAGSLEVTVGAIRLRPSRPLAWPLDTRTLRDGSHTLTIAVAGSVPRRAHAVRFDVKNAGTTCDAPPFVMLAEPAAGAALRGAVRLRARLADDRAIARATLAVDGRTTFEAAAPPVEATWNTDSASEGEHRLTATALDTAGQRGEDSIRVVVDRTSPTVRLLAPADGEEIREAIAMSAEAADAFGLAEVTFTVKAGEEILFERRIPAPAGRATASFIPEQSAGGALSVEAAAKDRAGNVSFARATVRVGAAEGAACKASSDCRSKHCVDGLCCNDSCEGTCHACNLPASPGRCQPVPAGREDVLTCTGGHACDGAGACRAQIGTGCKSGAECGSGFCVDGVCCESACDGACRACNGDGTAGRCRPVVGGFDPETCKGACDAFGSCRLRKGEPCMAGGTCASGLCVDGVCCEDACDGACRTCAGKGTAGTCTALVGADDSPVCTGDRTCDGAGRCRSKLGVACGDASACASGFCADGVCCDAVCSDACRSCGLAGKAGTCAPLARGREDAPMCLGAGRCDGAASCKKGEAQPCSADAECAVGACREGICCGDDACIGSYGFTKVIGGPGNERANALALTADGGMILAGSFVGTVDFDPGPGKLERSTPAGDPNFDAFVVKLDAMGRAQWVQTFGSPGADEAMGVAVGKDGRIWVAGYYSGEVDFAAGAKAAIRGTGAGSVAGYLVRLAANGTFQSVETWTADPATTMEGWSPTLKMVDLFLDAKDAPLLVGVLDGEMDLDPGPAQDRRAGSPPDGQDFLVKLKPDGKYHWGRFIDSRLFVSSVNGHEGVTMAPDGSVYVAGAFVRAADLDPTEGTDERPASGAQDVALFKLGPEGQYLWGQTIGSGPGVKSVQGLAVLPDGGVAMAGHFDDAWDIDPGPAIETRLPRGQFDSYLRRVGPDGKVAWTRVFGGPGLDASNRIAAYPDGSLILGGTFVGTVDFDPGPGTDSRTAENPGGDVFLLEVDGNGNHRSVRTRPGQRYWYRLELAPTSGGGLVVYSAFADTIDFKPGPAMESFTSAGEEDLAVTKFLP